jgi:Transposase
MIYRLLSSNKFSARPAATCKRKLDKSFLEASVRAHPDALLRERVAEIGVQTNAMWTAQRHIEIRKQTTRYGERNHSGRMLFLQYLRGFKRQGRRRHAHGDRCRITEGIDIAYDGAWCYHLLLISLANTGEPLYLVNRSGNRPWQEQADVFLAKAVDHCCGAGFCKILLRGDTNFIQTKHLDRWDKTGYVRFIFGVEAHDSLKDLEDALPAEDYSFLERPPRYGDA